MARIRTVKPDFWTDEVMVQLPYEARLLFIGLWNVADDSGALWNEPERVALQLFPGDAHVDVAALLDLLVAAGRLDAYEGEKPYLVVRNWDRHQKISHPSPTKIEGGRKVTIPNAIRRAVAAKYGVGPGEEKAATCYFCGEAGSIRWWRLPNGKPSKWVTFAGLELDHFQAEAAGGPTCAENIVLSCRECNRSRCDGDPITFALRSVPEDSGDLRPDREGEREGDRETPIVQLAAARVPAGDVDRVWGHYSRLHPLAKLTKSRRELIKRRLREYEADVLIAAIDGNHRDPYCSGDNQAGKRYHDLGLCIRDAEHIERYAGIVGEPDDTAGRASTLEKARQWRERTGLGDDDLRAVWGDAVADQLITEKEGHDGEAA